MKNSLEDGVQIVDHSARVLGVTQGGRIYILATALANALVDAEISASDACKALEGGMVEVAKAREAMRS